MSEIELVISVGSMGLPLELIDRKMLEFVHHCHADTQYTLGFWHDGAYQEVTNRELHVEYPPKTCRWCGAKLYWTGVIDKAQGLARRYPEWSK